MKRTQQGKTHFFVDESGDTTFYNKKGFPIVGTPGCSSLVLIGFVEVTGDPSELRHQIIDLHNSIIANPDLQKKPSFKKTAIALHAKDDCPEVREIVFDALSKMRFCAQIVVAQKDEQAFRNQFGANENRLYDHLVTLLFRTVLHRFSDNRIIFARRGSRPRQKPLTKAIANAVQIFEKHHNRRLRTEIDIQPQSPKGEPCLSVIDYVNWAVYRAFVNQDMKYYKMIERNVAIIKKYNEDFFSGSTVFCKKNPLDAEKATPLVLGSK